MASRSSPTRLIATAFLVALVIAIVADAIMLGTIAAGYGVADALQEAIPGLRGG